MPNQSHGAHVFDQCGKGENETGIFQPLLQITDIPIGRITEEQHGIPSRVQVSQEQDLKGKFWIRTSCGKLFVSRYSACCFITACVRRLTAVVDPAVDELIPDYAYHRKSPSLWFRKAGTDVSPCFSAVRGALIRTY